MDNSRAALRVTFGVIASLAILGNALVCAVILRSRTMLKNSYNLMILALAFTDLFTGIILAITPAFVIGDENFPVPENVGGEIFCHIISSHFFVFTFGKFSVALVMLLAIDRWYAITRPAKYKASFKRRRVVLYITSVSLICCALNWQALIEKKLVVKDGVPSCVWMTLVKSKSTAQVFTVIYVMFTFFIPLFISMITFFHLWRVMRRSRDRFSRSNHTKAFKSLLRMCAITGLFLALCWIPNQFVYMLSKFSVTQLDTPLHHATVVLAMFNSCINPWIYGATNRNYRRKFKRILCFWKKVEVGPEATDITAKEGGTGTSHEVRVTNTEQQPEVSGRGVESSASAGESSLVKDVYDRGVESSTFAGVSSLVKDVYDRGAGSSAFAGDTSLVKDVYDRGVESSAFAGDTSLVKDVYDRGAGSSAFAGDNSLVKDVYGRGVESSAFAGECSLVKDDKLQEESSKDISMDGISAREDVEGEMPDEIANDSNRLSTV